MSPNNYAIPHSQIPQIELLLKCISSNIPVILLGNRGRNSLLNFISSIFSLKMVQIDCHKDTDIFDLLGQYRKAENSTDSIDINNNNGNCLLFEWCDGLLVKYIKEPSLIVFNNPEMVDKCVFDRLNSLFEDDRRINVYEKVEDTFINIHPQVKFVLCCDNVCGLSPALIDRCYIIELCERYSYIDLYKIFTTASSSDIRTEDILTSISNDCMKKLKSNANDTLFKELIGTESYINCSSLDIDIKKFSILGTYPAYLNRSLNIYNTLIESEIQYMFKLEMEEYVPCNTDLLNVYKEISSYSTKLPTRYSDVIEILTKSPSITSFIKSMVFIHTNSYSSNNVNDSTEINKICCKSVSNTIYDLKVKFIKDLPIKTLSQFSDLLYFAKNISKISIDIFDDNFCYEAALSNFYKLLNDYDPLHLIRSELINEKIRKQNDIKKTISDTAISLYKYGRGDVASLIDEFNNISKKYTSSLSKIDNLLKRDYEKFKDIIHSITFCEYLNNRELRVFLEDFSDLHDYFLTYLFSKRSECTRCYCMDKEQYYSIKTMFYKTYSQV
ncbi:uncharacterized protein VICG_01542 [Vittaforma corneae ATCC 50505]|uniref:Uncharacterized protein n=1 Tax=Vittaforma corneae (strain ATCC 50505) TaxID=993615 RepID=L2GMA6_VITCO|nr:uncharacterized protein VICG_01542 [Vittaforma corneae ATCC 50505]ELA41437.1 hypothetical protein VICG_01542 [Vittaforma corneae ATCC 50505]